MKRWIALILVIAAFCAMALGSGHKRPIDTSEPDVSALKPKPLPAASAEVSEEETEPAGPTFVETVLYDQLDVTLLATGITYEASGPYVRFLLENESARRVRAACDGLGVNGYWFEQPTSCVAAPGGKVYGKMPVDPDLLAVCGIGEIAQVELDFTLSDANTGSSLPAGETVRLRTDAATENVYTADKTGRVIFYDSGVEITVKGRDGRAEHSADLVLCLGSTRDDPARVELTGFSVNGVPLEARLSAPVRRGKTLLAVIPAPPEALEERNVTEVERYGLSFEVYDEESGDLLAATGTIRVGYEDLRSLP